MVSATHLALPEGKTTSLTLPWMALVKTVDQQASGAYV